MQGRAWLSTRLSELGHGSSSERKQPELGLSEKTGNEISDFVRKGEISSSSQRLGFSSLRTISAADGSLLGKMTLKRIWTERCRESIEKEAVAHFLVVSVGLAKLSVQGSPAVPVCTARSSDNPNYRKEQKKKKKKKMMMMMMMMMMKGRKRELNQR
ncbi:uncharacterized protein LOC116255047 isoform X2 [Nymphaea colorata]|uniref:uncharacterized protein LOC116255047 isoform X2 n=1 Tax=Nymphaea colorata TaxID=210225 RepID=UPI00129E2D5D|nr:uncharacterized protein LOC116255047 isoform X2 [Nymphaea colorata]